MRYRLNDTDVVAEVLDGEVIVIHLTSGTYYSLQASAADLWSALVGGWAIEEIGDRLAGDAADERARICAEATQFVATLAAEGLILPADSDAGARLGDFRPQAAYSTPELQKYTDMQELLLVDPIHEVTEAGWPIQEMK